MGHGVLASSFLGTKIFLCMSHDLFMLEFIHTPTHFSCKTRMVSSNPRTLFSTIGQVSFGQKKPPGIIKHVLTKNVDFKT